MPYLEVYNVANLAAFSGACRVLVAAVRGVCNPNKSRPAHAEALFGDGILCVSKMKEYDA